MKEGLIETEEWVKAKRANTIESLESFLQRYPDTQRKSEVERLLAPLHEARDWVKAGEGRSIEAIEQFLSRYPSSDHAEAARLLLRPLREAKAWEAASTATSPAMVERYLETYPDSKHAAAARQLKQALYWQHEWAQGRAKMTVIKSLDCERGLLLYDRDGTAHRNGATVSVTGSIQLKNIRGEVLTLKLAGIIWCKEETLQNSFLYSYDTGFGVSAPEQFEGLVAQPTLDPVKPIAVFKMLPYGMARFQR
jgi:hypothetical protein